MEKKDRTAYVAALLGVILGVLLVVAYTGISSKKRQNANYAQWRKLNLILEQVQKNYVDTVDVKKLTDAAVVAALAKLDPHTIYLPPAELKESETELAGNFDGIGIQFNVPNDTAIVLEVIKGGPAEKAGLLQGDRLLSIDDSVIAGVSFPQDSMVRRMKGPSGTKVNITVSRDKERIPFEITRGKIPVNSVDAYFMLNDTTGYLKLSKFTRSTYKDVMMASLDLLSKGMTRLIFDLRDNTGGFFDQALLLADMFLEKNDEVVYIQGLHRKREEYKASGNGILKQVQLSVLINESSASSSEIFAGAIQDNDRGVIVGRRSFGKGLVQEPVYFTDGSGVRITVARFYTPSGRCIQKPYSDDYSYDIYKRFADGEMFVSDSIKIDSTAKFLTKGYRTVYGGGGIIPDLFVPMDTTLASAYYVACNKKSTQVRFASDVFDRYKSTLALIDNFTDLDTFFNSVDMASLFQTFAKVKDGISPAKGEWEKSAPYLMPQIKALVGRYSKLGENAFYKLYLEIDDVVKLAVASSSKVEISDVPRIPMAI